MSRCSLDLYEIWHDLLIFSLFFFIQYSFGGGYVAVSSHFPPFDRCFFFSFSFIHIFIF